MGKLAGRVAVISGAARGQGAAEARLFTAEGARVVVADVRRDEGCELAQELGPSSRFTYLDVAQEDSWESAVKYALQEFGNLDILVNNAAVYYPTPLLNSGSQTDAFMRAAEINQLGVFLGIRAAAPHMKTGGSIVNIASTAGIKALPGYSAYVASKYAVRGLSRTASLELAPARIRVNCVLPGMVDTPMITDRLADPGVQKVMNDLPAGRPASADEIARAVLFFASDDSSYCTGSELVCDGGLTTGTIPR
ncbi:SDR family NAD(P)-dependent oxidoreductase [Hoyosella altamirensis]|uniref:3alpha(Or 20beta)-hydroxysteroid dehydrogenase n=1 Tax=Hoyosella altamirensis TaxID=616997 RepID=A0A839RQH6_9ACTN|nr:glucose 1-dehydrogenase [Hoyosella altamirensis]MBB3039242.1 3alpha(or 20beta)-hydroxysteroid dehydrogenase [Hoyosella altamirensis]